MPGLNNRSLVVEVCVFAACRLASRHGIGPPARGQWIAGSGRGAPCPAWITVCVSSICVRSALHPPVCDHVCGQSAGTLPLLLRLRPPTACTARAGRPTPARVAPACATDPCPAPPCLEDNRTVCPQCVWLCMSHLIRAAFLST